MLIYDWDENAKKQAKAFKLNLVEGSVAQRWFNTDVPEAAKSDWNLLLPLLREKFDNAIEDRRSAFQYLSTAKLEDSDIGCGNGKGGLKHVDWARAMSSASQKVGDDADGNNAFLVVNNIGQATRNLLTAMGATSTVGSICYKIETLTPSDIETIKGSVKRDQENKDMKTKLAHLERQFRPELRGGSFREQRENGWSSAFSKDEPAEQENQVVFPSNAGGIQAYKQAVQAFYSKWGDNAYANANRPFPLTPGTDPAGSNECYNCGKADHLRSNCRASYTIPENEQRYRGSVNKAKREQQGRSALSSLGGAGNKPLRMIGHEEDPRFSHLARMNHAYLPLSPPDSEYADLPGNGDGPHY
ncbi:hypothetical protein FFLO_07073 [Filobasidium floriforme]|uniref:CCHC-type domain-containing protein n=1 Tax=Filobasidium floriforme TaxID=5210 RepID=A0A8K0JF11_9TREE|nr:hypothetical protein FFLO_07073 [Filobasidium floriforme]